jgi:hypothetical protein
MRAVEITGIDVVHAKRDCLAQDSYRRITILRWAKQWAQA